MSAVVTGFSNDVSARPATLLKAVTTTDILLDKFHKSQNSYFKEHLKIILLKSVPTIKYGLKYGMIAPFKKQFH